MPKKYKKTLLACYNGFIVQAAIITFLPLLFVVFNEQYNISLEKLGLLILVNFVFQLLTDFICIKLVNHCSYRIFALTAHFFAVIGLVTVGITPFITDNIFTGLVIAVILLGIAGGFIEVTMSPIVEALPTDDKSGSMSLLHSFFCWGQAAVILITTLFLHFMGREVWYIVPFIWAIIPAINFIAFIKVPLPPITQEQKGASLKSLFSKRTFLLALAAMLCGGAAELSMSQWASFFAETGLGVSKVWGDIFGPCFFAVLMGIGRTILGIKGDKLNLTKVLILSSALCIAAYLVAVFSPEPVISLIACGICGLSVAVMWPGSVSQTAKKYPFGGAKMFAMLAVFGDIGCASGPWLAGYISEVAEKANSPLGGLKTGLLFATIFPTALLVIMLYSRFKKSNTKQET